MAAHELRTPVQSLLWNNEVIETRLAHSAEGLPREWLAERLERNRRYAARLSELVDKLLEATQLETGGIELDPEELDLSELLREVLARHLDALEWSGST